MVKDVGRFVFEVENLTDNITIKNNKQTINSKQQMTHICINLPPLSVVVLFSTPVLDDSNYKNKQQTTNNNTIFSKQQITHICINLAPLSVVVLFLTPVLDELKFIKINNKQQYNKQQTTNNKQ